MADVGTVLVATVVAKRLGYEVADLIGQDRHGGVARARHLAMAVARSTLQRSYPELGRAFGGRDHTTALSAARRVLGRVESSAVEAALFLELEAAARSALESEFGRAGDAA